MSVPATMRAAVQKKPGVLEIAKVPVPAIEQHEVLIRVKCTGICGTDYSIYTGKYSAEYLPMIPGHEFSGIVAEVGAGVTNVKPGDRVTADINMSCGTCFYCRRGQKLLCPHFHQLGIHCDGSYAEYVKAPHSQVRVLPDGLSFEQGAFVEPVACVVHSTQALDMEMGSTIAIIGAGLGILHGIVGKHRGAACTMLVGTNAERLGIAKQMGIDHVINASECDPIAEVMRITEGRGADYVIEAVGKPETYEQAIAMSRPGGTIGAFGITAGDDTIRVKPFDFVLGERKLVGSCAGVGRDWDDAIALMESGRIRPEPMFSLKVPLEALEAAIRELRVNRDLMKVFVSPEATEWESLG